MKSTGTPIDVAILMPVYNDWNAAEAIIGQLGTVLAKRKGPITVVLVDDGSSPHLRSKQFGENATAFHEIIVVNLRRNVGHQRAIAIGLAWIYEHLVCRSVVVMDADGQDRPEDVPRLLDRFEQGDASSVVFAERIRRGEGIVFSCFYHLYRMLHWFLTGISVRVGNFSVLSFDHLATLVSVSDLWNHYAAGIFKSKLPHDLLPTTRGQRISGKSHMNFVGLVTHGLSAISVFGDTVGVRLLIGSAIASFLLLGILALVLFIRFAGDGDLGEVAPAAARQEDQVALHVADSAGEHHAGAVEDLLDRVLVRVLVDAPELERQLGPEQVDRQQSGRPVRPR